MPAAAARGIVLELLHPIPSLLTTVAALGFAWIFGIGSRDPRFWSIGAIMLLVQFSISALNEWADAGLDRRAGRQRPIPLGLVSRGAALTLAVVCAVSAFSLCVLSNLGPLALLLVGLGTSCGWAYDLWLKATPLSFVPFAIAFPLMPFWIGVLAGRPLMSLIVLFVGGSPLAGAIHLGDSIPDRDRDREAGLKTLAVALGKPAAEMAAAGLLLLGTLVSIVLLIRRGQPSIGALSLVAVAGSGVVVGLSARGTPSSSLLGKWAVIAAAAVAAVPLVVSVSEP
ncbi:MAG TPA: UbiA family prenyltransferase [Candidatus Dormibacteraeota bacterium]|nr:UbiA family prenyltransferase [Candidatus Dormibacteraeota bacterium]